MRRELSVGREGGVVQKGVEPRLAPASGTRTWRVAAPKSAPPECGSTWLTL